MGRFKFEVNLPSIFGKKTIANFNLDNKFFEFSDYFLIDSYSVDCVVEIEKKNGFWQLDLSISGFANTYCDKCGDPLVLNLKGTETYFFKKEDGHNSQSHNVIYLTYLTEPVNLESVLKEALFFVVPRTKIHNDNDCNLQVLKKLEVYQKKSNKTLLSDYLKKKLK